MIFISCGEPQEVNKDLTEQEDVFYTSNKDGDLYRIPLIKPIQVISTIGYGDDWIIKLPYQQITGIRSIEVNSITIVDSLIIVYSGLVSLPGETTKSWFIIDTKNSTEKVYKNNISYQKGLSELGMKEEPKLYEVNELYSQFIKEKRLPF
jgi:hypothetical protein